MSQLAMTAPEVFSLAEVAEAAGVSVAAVADLVENGRIRTGGGYLIAEDAVVCVRALRRLARTHTHELFATDPTRHGSPITGIAGSSVLHLCLAGIFALAATVGLDQVSRPPQRLEAARLVFLATPGLGGGGGGGGLKQPAPPPKAEMRLPVLRVKSPVPRPKPLTTQRPERLVSRPAPPPVVSEPKPRPAEPPPPPPQPALEPQVVAPVATASTDARDKAGILSETPAASNSQGPGSGGGVGTGQGTGIGEGTGSGIGPGSGGGTGGGPYRPGAGISPPSVIHEVRPDYTDDARRQGIEGEVVLEIVVRRDGTVGDVRVLEGLRGGLDRRAIDAVRQWRFSPARRYGSPVDVIVEVAVEFKLR
jgi:TonB family protein